MKPDCDKCGKPATVHLTEIVDGQKIEKHLCEDCASSEGITVKANLPISQLLEDFILQTASREEVADLECDVCGMTFSDFRQRSVLGCPNDYDAFEEQLGRLLERAHDGVTHHIGKSPKSLGARRTTLQDIRRFKRQLADAVAAEDYERAAELRDRIRGLEGA